MIIQAYIFILYMSMLYFKFVGLSKSPDILLSVIPTVLMAMDGSRPGFQVFWYNVIGIESWALASLVILAYDHLLTLGLEIELVWPAPWTLGKLIYFCTTYSAWIDSVIVAFAGSASIPLSHCTILYKIARWFLIWGYVLAALVLVYRTWAIWERSRKMLFCLLFLVTLFVALEVSLYRTVLQGIEFVHVTPQGITCVVAKDTGKTRFEFISYIPVVIFESIILGLTLYKGRGHFRFSRSALVMTMYRDSLLYYVYIIALTLLNMLVTMLSDDAISGTNLIQMERVMYTVLTKRMLLNLRDSLSQDRSQWAPASRFTDLSTIEYNEE